MGFGSELDTTCPEQWRAGIQKLTRPSSQNVGGQLGRHHTSWDSPSLLALEGYSSATTRVTGPPLLSDINAIIWTLSWKEENWFIRLSILKSMLCCRCYLWCTALHSWGLWTGWQEEMAAGAWSLPLNGIYYLAPQSNSLKFLPVSTFYFNFLALTG